MLSFRKFEHVEIKNILEYEIQAALENTGRNPCSLKVFYEQAKKAVEEKLKKTSLKNETKSKDKAKKKTESSSDDDNQNKKKPSMKKSSDVIHRIQWDTRINKDYIIVGYLDRFLGIKECSFNTFDWGDIVLADIDALAIPQHRINYFKYKNEIIWDKNKRIDNVYGSTGSNQTIYDIIDKLENVEYVPKLDGSDDEPPAKPGKAKPQDPNYFLSIPIDCSEIKKNFTKLTDDLIENSPEIEEIIIPDSSLHVTLCTLRVDNEASLKEVIKAIEAVEGLTDCMPIEIEFKAIGSFYDKVLYIKGDCDMEKLSRFRCTIMDSLHRNNVVLAGNYYDFVPHLTVAKISNKNKNLESIEDLVSSELLNSYETFHFGRQSITELHLCKMANIFKSTTYPVDYIFKLQNHS